MRAWGVMVTGAKRCLQMALQTALRDAENTVSSCTLAYADRPPHQCNRIDR